MNYIAHSSPKGQTEPHYLDTHTKGVLKKAIEFSKSFDPYGITEIAAIVHDLGKKSPEFQRYISAKAKIRGSVKHALAGALLLDKILDSRAMFAGIAVAGHHVGLDDLDSLSTKKTNALPYLIKVAENSEEELRWARSVLKKTDLFENPKSEDEAFSAALLTKMCFSSLIDADYLDTERFLNEEKADFRNKKEFKTIEELRADLSMKMAKLKKETPESDLKGLRNDVFESCIKAGKSSESFRSLNVPTGAGKTFAGMGYALEHAFNFRKRRVIVALPFTSIIDQNSDQYKEIFGKDQVIEHHSTAENHEDTEEELDQQKLSTENWDSPIIMTTTIQLFESLFANRTAKCRKLHNIADSVIILDEFQALPLGLLKPIFRMLRSLMEDFGVTVVVSSATPLDFSFSEILDVIGEPEEIVPNNNLLFKEMKRVNFQRLPKELSYGELANKIVNHKRVLCIVNTKKDALGLYEKLIINIEKSDESVFHLSTSMTPSHRKRTLDCIGKRLKDKKPIQVVSTQLIEAGVDLDFPIVYRAFAPIDSIIQAAGRCNREGKLEVGKLYLFGFLDGGKLPNDYEKKTNIAMKIINRGLESLHELEFNTKYFRELYDYLGMNGLDKKEILTTHPFYYSKIASNFKMIENDTVSLLCALSENEIEQEIISKLIVEAKNMPRPSKEWFRKVQQYSVSAYRNSKFIREFGHLIEPITDDFFIWKGGYSEKTGITTSLAYDPDKICH